VLCGELALLFSPSSFFFVLFLVGGVCGADVINDPLTKIVDSLLKGPGHQRLLYGLSGMRSLTMGRVYDAMQKKIRKFKDAKKKDKVEEIESWYPGVTKMDRSGYFLTIDDFNGAGTSIGSMFGCGKDVMIPLAEGIRDGTSNDYLIGFLLFSFFSSSSVLFFRDCWKKATLCDWNPYDSGRAGQSGRRWSLQKLVEDHFSRSKSGDAQQLARIGIERFSGSHGASRHLRLAEIAGKV
jgi:hypothetical protein